MTRRLLLGAAVALAAIGCSTLPFVTSGQVALAADTPLDPTIKPDAVLSPGQTVVFKHNEPLVGSEFTYSPAECRGDTISPPYNVGNAPLSCKAYRIAVNVDPDPKAYNVVLFQADFEQVELPSLVAVAAGVNPPPLNGVDVYIFDTEDHYLGQNAPGILDPVTGPGDPTDLDPGGSGFGVPERGGFQPKQRFYDIVVDAAPGVNQNFTLRLTMSNELFKAPNEILEDPAAAFGDDAGSDDAYVPPFFSGVPTTGDSSDFTLPPADVLPDEDIARVGLGVDEQFTPQQGLALGGRTRNISTDASAPSTLTLLLGLVLLPLAATGGIVGVARRRRNAFLSE